MQHVNPQQFEKKPPFSQWLVAQENRAGAIGELAKFAKADRAFPRDGTPKDAWKRLNQVGAESDLYAAMEEAELDWLAL